MPLCLRPDRIAEPPRRLPEPKPESTGLLARTEKKQPETKINDAVRLLKLMKEKTHGRNKTG